MANTSSISNCSAADTCAVNNDATSCGFTAGGRIVAVCFIVLFMGVGKLLLGSRV